MDAGKWILTRRDASSSFRLQLQSSLNLRHSAPDIDSSVLSSRTDPMPDRPPFPGRPAQPPGLTHLEYSPDGKRLNVAGCGNFARSFRVNETGEPDMLMDIHEDTFAIASGVCGSCIDERTTLTATERLRNIWLRRWHSLPIHRARRQSR